MSDLPEEAGEAIEAGRRAIESSECYQRPWHEPASSCSLANAAYPAIKNAIAPHIRKQERERLRETLLSDPSLAAIALAEPRLRLLDTLDAALDTLEDSDA